MAEQCPECKCYGGHTPQCSIAPPEYKARQLERFGDLLRERVAEADRLRERIEFWQSKCAVLRHENNRLRKKLSNITKR